MADNTDKVVVRVALKKKDILNTNINDKNLYIYVISTLYWLLTDYYINLQSK